MERNPSNRRQDFILKMASRFDDAAAQWDNNPGRVALARAVGEAIGRTIPIQPDWRVLDYGAGTGLLTLNLQPRVASMVALDSSTGMLEKLTQKLAAAAISNVQTLHWNLEAEPFPETGFDLAVSSMTLHHLRHVPLVFSRLADLLKPGAWLAVADLDAEDGSFHDQADDVFHHGFQRPQIAEWLTNAGLRWVSVTDAHSMVKPGSTGQMRSYGVFLAVGQKGRD
jgi:ubiquinone/menaquinone biosynthesis C-methylase UbiE